MHSTIRRTVLFFIMLFVLLNVLCSIFREHDPLQTGGYEDYKRLPQGIVDAVYIGNSGVSRYWLCSEAYDKYGMVVFPLSTDGMPSWLVQSMVSEAYKYQTPELAIIDVRSFTQVLDENTCEAEIHYVLDMLPRLSVNRLTSIIRTIKVQSGSRAENIPPFGLSYFFPILSFHDKWMDHDIFNTEEEEDTRSFLGYYARKHYSVRGTTAEQERDLTNSVKDIQTEERVPLDPTAEKSLKELLCYLKKQDMNVLFLASPSYVDEELIGKYKTISDLLSEYEYEFLVINAADIGEYELNYKKDFLDRMHTSYSGAKKYTYYLADYLNTKYDFPDHRSDPDTSMLDRVSQQIEDFLT